MMSVVKRLDGHPSFAKRYFNVSLVLNGNTDDQMTTNTPDGFNNDTSPFITWYKPTNEVNTVELIFRDNQHAHLVDLKIYYHPEL